MTADVHGTLTGHVFADFIHNLRGGQFPLTGITSAGINQGFVLSQDLTALWCKFHTFSPCPAGFPAGHKSVAEDITVMEHIAAAEQVTRPGFKIEIAAQRLRHLI